MNNPVYYFIPLTEFEFLFMAGLSQLVKTTTHRRTVLLHSSHPRIKDKMQEYYGSFDDVIKLPYCRYRKNFIVGYAEFLSAYLSVRRIRLTGDRLLFNCSGRQLINMLFLNHFKKQRGNSKALFVQILPYPENRQGMSISIPNSMILSAYSLFLKRIVLYRYEREQPTYYGYISRPDWDVLLYVEHVGAPVRGRFYQGVPSSLEFIDVPPSVEQKCCDFQNPGVLILVDASVPEVYGLSDKIYWDVIRNLADYLKKTFACEIYVKMHPNCANDVLDRYRIKAHPLNAKVAAEEYYIAKRDQIVAVYSTPSTALLTARWLGIPAFSICDLVGYSGAIRERFRTYLAPCSDIVNIQSIEDIRKIRIADLEPDTHTCSAKELRWRQILTEVEGFEHNLA